MLRLTKMTNGFDKLDEQNGHETSDRSTYSEASEALYLQSRGRLSVID